MSGLVLQENLRSRFAQFFNSELTIRTPWWPIVFRPGILGMVLALTICSGFLMISRQSQMGTDSALIWLEAILAGVLAFVALFIHETGHAVVGKGLGRTIVRLQFGLAGGAVTSGDSTPLRRIAGLAAGPLAEIAFGSVLFTLGGHNWDNALGVAGFMALLNGIGNLIPFHRATDGFKILRFTRLVLRGNPTLECAPTGPCPACYGDFPKVAVPAFA